MKVENPGSVSFPQIMGLLSDPEAGPSKILHLIIMFHRPLCFLLCIGGYGWFCLLAHKSFNNGNYFSENALLPGLVQSDLVDDGSSKQFFRELQEEIKENYASKDSMPVPWISAKMHQLNLDVYTHNFTLHYPMGKGQTFRGENVYGILRAGRTASSEALVLSSPFRPASSLHKSTNAGIALMLSFAKFARTRKYWAKDIIFLVTEHEQLGAQAWLEAYHGEGKGESDTTVCLKAGDMRGRAGAIQAAVNLEMSSLALKYVEVKVEGLNGQLPNLDLVNLVHKMCIKSNVYHAYKNSYSWSGNNGPWKNYLNSLSTLLGMVTAQVSGVPTGNHGLFHRYGIEAVTLEGIDATPGRGGSGGGGKAAYALEGTLRSLNNLLERFHQSFFFYLRPATDRFVSIGQYMPPLGILAGTLFIRAFSLWLTTQKQDSPKAESDKTSTKDEKKDDSSTNESNEDMDETQDSTTEAIDTSEDPTCNVNLLNIGKTYLVTHWIGYVLMCSPRIITEIGVTHFELPSEQAIFYGFCIIAAFLTFALPKVLPCVGMGQSRLLLTLALLELGTLLITLAMHNFSLAFCLAAVYAPIALIADIKGKKSSRAKAFINKVLWLLVHPLVLICLVVFIYSAFAFPDESVKALLIKGLFASQQAIMFSIVDGMIYGNWLFNIVATFLFPIWMLFWQTLNAKME